MLHCFFYRILLKERESHLLKKLATLLQAQLVIMTRSTYEVVAQAPAGYVWADNGQEELSDQQWDGETKQSVNQNMVSRMRKGLKKC